MFMRFSSCSLISGMTERPPIMPPRALGSLRPLPADGSGFAGSLRYNVVVADL